MGLGCAGDKNLSDLLVIRNVLGNVCMDADMGDTMRLG